MLVLVKHERCSLRIMTQSLPGERKYIYILFAASNATLAEEKNLFWESLNIFLFICV